MVEVMDVKCVNFGLTRPGALHELGVDLFQVAQKVIVEALHHAELGEACVLYLLMQNLGCQLPSVFLFDGWVMWTFHLQIGKRSDVESFVRCTLAEILAKIRLLLHNL